MWAARSHPNYGGETGLQGLLPLNTSFFRGFGVTEVPSHTALCREERGGLKSPAAGPVANCGQYFIR